MTIRYPRASLPIDNRIWESVMVRVRAREDALQKRRWSQGLWVLSSNQDRRDHAVMLKELRS